MVFMTEITRKKPESLGTLDQTKNLFDFHSTQRLSLITQLQPNSHTAVKQILLCSKFGLQSRRKANGKVFL